jgi:hypothetical protein
MRDIRSDLRERLAAVHGRYADEMANYTEKREELEKAHREAINSFERERAAIEQMLAVEDQRSGIAPAVSEARKTARLVRLEDFLVNKVAAHGDLSKDELRAEAELAGYFEEGDGRKFHLTLMNITNAGKLVRSLGGRYSYPHRDALNHFQNDQTSGENPETAM